MINLFNHYQNSFITEHDFTKKYGKIQKKSEINQYKNNHFSAKEWASSVYSYNISSSKTLVAKNFSANNIVRGYFNMFLGKITGFNRRKDNKNRYSADRVYTGRVELEHTNSELLILLPIYNKKRIVREEINNIYYVD